MIIKQILNNNVVISENEKGQEVVVMGKGLAFSAKKGQIITEEKIEKMFVEGKDYNSDHFVKLIGEIDLDNFEFIEELINYVKSRLGKKLNSSIYITLTDHINSLLERAELNAYVKNTMMWDIKRLYKEEFDLSKEVVERINLKLNSKFDDNEAASIAMHIINAELDTDMKTAMDITKVMTEILNIVKYNFRIIYDEESLSYYRFITHLRFFTQRVFKGNTYNQEDENELFDIVKEKYSKMYECSLKIKKFLQDQYNYNLENEECLYLTIHIAKVVRDSKSL